jgi:trigger factor
MSVVVSIQDVGPCRKQVKVEVPAPAVDAETQRVVAEYGRQVKIPGFRKGKVPADLVKRRFAKDIDQEVKERLLPRYWKQAQAEAGIDPLLPPDVEEVNDPAPGEALTFTAVVETRPKIELRNTDDFDLPDPSTEPGTLEIDETIENLAKQSAEWVTVDRAVSQGDLAELAITRTGGAHHEPGDEEKVDKISIEVGDKNVWEELSVAVLGLRAGQETTFDRSHTHPAAEEGGEPEVHVQHFKVRIEAVKERDMPALDDAFAAKVNAEFKTFDDLRTRVSDRLRENLEARRRAVRETALLDQLRERHPIELPTGVVRREVERLVQDYAEQLHRGGIDIEKAGIDWNRVADERQADAAKLVHARLLLDAVADDRGLQVEEEEFESALAVLARTQGTSTPQLRRKLDEDGRLASLRAQLRRDKTLRALLGETVQNVAAPEAGA